MIYTSIPMNYNFIKFKHCGYISDRIRYYKKHFQNMSSLDVSKDIIDQIGRKLNIYEPKETWYLDPIEIYTCGSCKGNPGQGGYGAVLTIPGVINKKHVQGSFNCTTSNQMEIVAVIESLLLLKQRCDCLKIYTDSVYVCNAFNGDWLYSCVKRDWTTKDGNSIINKTLWEMLLYILSFHHFTFYKVKVHNQNYYNNLASDLATGKIRL